MGIFDRLRGRRAEAEEEAEQPQAPAAAAPSVVADLTEAPVDAARVFAAPAAEESSRLYNPYDGEWL
jgi:hypothetical protein